MAISLVFIFGILNGDRIFSLKYIYIYGFVLFIGGRFIAYLLNKNIDVFKFDFGLVYELDASVDKFYLFTLVYGSIFFFIFANVINRNNFIDLGVRLFLLNKSLIYIFTLFLCCFVLKDNLANIFRSLSEGYLSLYSAQSEQYSTPLSLIVSAVLISMIGLLYIENSHQMRFKVIIIFFIFVQLLTIITGSRGGFVSVILLSGWLFLREKRFSLKSVFLLTMFAIFLVIFVNMLLSFSSRSSEEGSILEIITNNLNNQGISLMVFDLSTRTQDYPFPAFLKTIIPGSQLFFHYFIGDVQVYDVSFPHYLTFISAPDLYDQGYGFGWALLSDFYVFSFSNLALFFILNFLWGRLIYNLDNYDRKSYYKGLSF
ncbi:hypothetical protein HMPREF9417_2005, partial [Haemophilus parainfluenzae ATCC 33392]